MLKQVLHKLFSIVMALLLLLSTVSFTVEKHFCDDVLIDVAIFNDVENCCKEDINKIQFTIENESCCSSTFDFIIGQNQLTLNTIYELDLDQQTFLTACVFAFGSLHKTFQKQPTPHLHYNPPHLIADIQVLDQIFLI